MDIEFALQRLPQTLVVVSGNGVADEQVPQQFGVIVSGLVTDRNNVNLFGDNHIALFGLRHVGATTGSPLSGSIEDARIYGQALTAQQLAALEPNQAGELEPLAWWVMVPVPINT